MDDLLEHNSFEDDLSKDIYKDSDLFYEYIKHISKYSLLTKEEEEILLKEYRNGNIKAKNKLVEANLRLVVWVAKKFTNSNDNIMDLIQEGNKELIAVIDKFDESLGYKFSTYATWCIKRALQLYKNKYDNALVNPEYMKLIIKKYEEYILEYNKKYGKKPTNEECCEHLNIKEYELMNILNSVKKAVSIDAPILSLQNSEEPLALVDCIEDKTENVGESITDKIYTEQIMETIISLKNINEKELFIVLARNGVLRNGIGASSPQTLKEVAELLSFKYGIKELTAERIRQIEEKTYKKIRRKIKSIV